jgi:nucleoside-diphosphate-sugar epimerase
MVTGSRGFTGQYLCKELLDHDYRVSELRSDLLDATSLQDEIAQLKPEAVIHLAGISYVDATNIDLMYQVNILGTRNLLLALSDLSQVLESVILASTGNVYGNAGDMPITESFPVSPLNDYAVSKLSMENMAKLWMDKLPLCITRPFNYTGIGQAEHFLVPKIIEHFRTKAPRIELGNLTVQREFSDVRYVAEIYRRILEKKPVSEIVNVAAEKAYTLEQLIDQCSMLTGHSIEVISNQSLQRSNEVHCLTGSNAKLNQIIGQFDEIELKDTLSWMLDQGE